MEPAATAVAPNRSTFIVLRLAMSGTMPPSAAMRMGATEAVGDGTALRMTDVPEKGRADATGSAETNAMVTKGNGELERKVRWSGRFGQ
jgi:hypothetical protein